MAVLINGRSAIHQNSKGTLTTQDVCYTGPYRIPITYYNIAKSKDALNTARKVLVNGKPVCHKKSYFSPSMGDESGDQKGIKSNTITGKAEFITASLNVFIEGIPAVRAGDLMVSNNRNTAPAQLQQPSAPYNNDQNKIDSFKKCALPSIEFDLSQLTAQTFPAYVTGRTAICIISTKGNINAQQPGECNPLTFNLTEYKIFAKEVLSKFFSTVMLVSSEKGKIEIGSALVGDYCLTSTVIKNNTCVFKCSPQPIQKVFQNWMIEGSIGFELEVTIDNGEFEPIVLTEPEIIGEKLATVILDLLTDKLVAIWAEE